jgi:hypothetical protein
VAEDKLTLELAVIWNCRLVSDLVVVYPVIVSVKLFEAKELMPAVRSCGAASATLNSRVWGLDGVRFKPAWVEKDGVMVTVVATEPVCNPIWLDPFGNTALVELAAMLNTTV